MHMDTDLSSKPSETIPPDLAKGFLLVLDSLLNP